MDNLTIVTNRTIEFREQSFMTFASVADQKKLIETCLHWLRNILSQNLHFTKTPYKGNQSDNVVLIRPTDCLLQTTYYKPPTTRSPANMSDEPTAQASIRKLVRREDWPMFSIDIQNHLRSKNIEWVLDDPPRPLPTLESLREKWVDLGFTNKQLRIKPADLVKEREKHELQLAYAAGFINQSVGDIYKPFISNAEQALEKWNALKERFEDLNPAAVTDIVTTFFTKRVQDFKSVEEFVSYITSNLDRLIEMDQPISYEILAQAALLHGVSSTKYAQFKTTKRTNWTQENTDPRALGKELIVFDSELDQEASTILVARSNDGTSTKRKIAPVGTCKHPNCIRYNRTTHYEEDCWERNPENAPKNIGDRIRARKKPRMTQASVQLDEHSNQVKPEANS